MKKITLTERFIWVTLFLVTFCSGVVAGEYPAAAAKAVKQAAPQAKATSASVVVHETSLFTTISKHKKGDNTWKKGRNEAVKNAESRNSAKAKPAVKKSAPKKTVQSASAHKKSVPQTKQIKRSTPRKNTAVVKKHSTAKKSVSRQTPKKQNHVSRPTPKKTQRHVQKAQSKNRHISKSPAKHSKVQKEQKNRSRVSKQRSSSKKHQVTKLEKAQDKSYQQQKQ
jgi:hypothetical protein